MISATLPKIMKPDRIQNVCCPAVGAFLTGYFLNYKTPKAQVAGPTLPLAKAFAQVIQVRYPTLLKSLMESPLKY